MVFIPTRTGWESDPRIKELPRVGLFFKSGYHATIISSFSGFLVVQINTPKGESRFYYNIELDNFLKEVNI